ncbi:PLP-dependent aminotransferase family protein [Candidatus Viridilinea mediisalina]|uniref:Aminotransferase n=1 Tax=Candidatus Viridilinea mediisalina TaxID=2024553 RepID=A0A2A6RDG6_9CHLR|nr:PLP-dependent aminotransferase family protein [Candidatus Viridilinea mediisalina]PDV98557.1 aminotransferase [Candidatus Viridilinea mediisalina]
MDGLWDERIAVGATELRSSAIRDLLKLTAQPQIISFAGGLPAAELFPAEEIALASERALAEVPMATLQYGRTEGYEPLRALVGTWLGRLGMDTRFEQVIITAGSQQALDLIGRLLIDPGAPVVVEEPTYLGALQAWQTCRPNYLRVPIDEQGLVVDALEQLLAKGLRPRFLYVVSCFQNPTGVTLAPARRRQLIELAARYELPIVEDDPYGDLYYEGERVTPLAALDYELHGEPRYVVYLGTLSKMLAPGLRVGWLVAPRAIFDQLVMLKQGLDLSTSSSSQTVAYYACRDGLLERHAPRIRALYRERRDAMLAALEREMPPEVRWTRPEGGMFLWLTLPEGYNSGELLDRAIEAGVAFVPGEPFHPGGGGTNTMRLNFSFSSVAQINEGVRRLAAAIRAR